MPSPPKSCEHCGNAFVPDIHQTRFCCRGCEHVFALINEDGFAQFYDLQAGAKTTPIENLAFEQRDYSWLGPMVEDAEASAETGSPATLELSVSGLSCAACVWLVQRVFERRPGALSAAADAARGRLKLTWDSGRCDHEDFAREVQSFGYVLGPPGEAVGGDPAMVKRLGLCAAFAMNAMAFTLPRYLGMPPDFVLANLFELVAAGSAVLTMLVGGSYFIGRAARALRHGVVHIDLPIALGVSAAFAGSMLGWIAGFAPLLYFDFVAVFIFLMLAGRWLQERTLSRNRSQLADGGGIPSNFRPESGDAPRPIEELVAGERYRISPGEIVPVASSVEHAAPFGLGWINGEAEAPTVPVGGIAPSGSLHLGETESHLVARESWDLSLLARLAQKTQDAEQEDPRLAKLITAYIVIVVVLGVSGAALWLASTGDWARSLQVAVSLFVVSCPCALGVALPLADRIAASLASSCGAYPQRKGFWPRLARMRKVVFDKTGTLTEGRPKLLEPSALQALSPVEARALLRLASSSPHPISRSLAEELSALRITGDEFDTCEVKEQPGHGLSMRDSSGTEWRLEKDDRSLTDAVFLCNGQTVAAFEFRDFLRSGAMKEVKTLLDQGIEIFLMSGDRESKVAAVATQLGISDSHWRARMTPDDKAAWVSDIDCADTLYLGDGANDSLAFDAATCTATPAGELALLQDKADLYFLGRGLSWLGRVREIAQRRKRAIWSVVGFSLLYNAAAATAALSGHMNPLLAAILMPLSSAVTIALIGASMRLKQQPNNPPQTSSNYQLNPAAKSPLLACGVEQSGSSSGS